MLSSTIDARLRQKISPRIASLLARYSYISPHNSLLGIDFSGQHIYGVALRYHALSSHQPNNYQLQAMAKVAVPKGAIVDHQLHNIEQVVQALFKLRARLKVRTRQVATAVSGSAVITKTLAVPTHLPPDLLDHHIRQLAGEQLPFSLSEINLDYEWLAADEPQAEQHRLLLSAARTEHIDARVAVLRQVGWRAQLVDISYHALARSVCFLYATAAEQGIAVLELNHESLIFMVVRNGDISYQRVQPLTYPSHTAHSSANFQQHLAQHAQRQCQLYCSQQQQTLPELCLLCGGVLELEKFLAPLSEALAIKLQLLSFENYWDKPPITPASTAGFGTALGLALRVNPRRALPCPI